MSTRVLAAGCTTSKSFMIVAPSFDMVTPCSKGCSRRSIDTAGEDLTQSCNQVCRDKLGKVCKPPSKLRYTGRQLSSISRQLIAYTDEIQAMRSESQVLLLSTYRKTYSLCMYELVHPSGAKCCSNGIHDCHASIDVADQLRFSLAGVCAVTKQYDLRLLQRQRH